MWLLFVFMALEIKNTVIGIHLLINNSQIVIYSLEKCALYIYFFINKLI